MRHKNIAVAAVLTLVLGLPAGIRAQDENAGLQAALTKALDKKQLKGVEGTVQGNTVVLHGTVDVYADKEEAGKRARRVKGVKSVDNEIEVAGPTVPDAELQQKVLRAIAYDRVGYVGSGGFDTTPFNAIAVKAQNGVVTLGGHAYGPTDADAAVSVASNTKGVRDVVNDIQVDPLSPNDDRIRLQAFRSIYGYPSLNKYAIDPGKAIRISVQNGNLTLYGVVDSQADKDAAGLRANTVPGVFKVTNDLQVANQERGR